MDFHGWTPAAPSSLFAFDISCVDHTGVEYVHPWICLNFHVKLVQYFMFRPLRSAPASDSCARNDPTARTLRNLSKFVEMCQKSTTSCDDVLLAVELRLGYGLRAKAPPGMVLSPQVRGEHCRCSSCIVNTGSKIRYTYTRTKTTILRGEMEIYSGESAHRDGTPESLPLALLFPSALAPRPPFPQWTTWIG